MQVVKDTEIIGAYISNDKLSDYGSQRHKKAIKESKASPKNSHKFYLAMASSTGSYHNCVNKH